MTIYKVPKINNSDQFSVPVNKSPDSGLPIRILKWYLSTLEDYQDTEGCEPYVHQFNRDQEKRRQEVQKAIDNLSAKIIEI